MKKRILKIKMLLLEYKEIVLYLFFGVCTTVINTVCYGFLYNVLKVGNFISTVLSWLVAVIFAYITNRKYVFESKKITKKEKIKEVTSFFSCRFLTGVLDVVIMVLAVDLLKWNGIMWKLISNIIVTIINYVASKILIFK